MNSADDELLEQAAQDVSAIEKSRNGRNRRTGGNQQKRRGFMLKSTGSVFPLIETARRKAEQTGSLVNSPLGDTSEGRRRSSGDLNAVPRLTPEDRQRLLGQ